MVKLSPYFACFLSNLEVAIVDNRLQIDAKEKLAPNCRVEGEVSKVAESTNLPGNQTHLLLYLYRCMHCTSVCQYRHYIWRRTNSLAPLDLLLNLYLLFKYTNILLHQYKQIFLLTYIISSEKKHFGHKQIWHNKKVFSVNVQRNWKHIDENTHLQTPNKTLIPTYTYSNLT